MGALFLKSTPTAFPSSIWPLCLAFSPPVGERIGKELLVGVSTIRFNVRNGLSIGTHHRCSVRAVVCGHCVSLRTCDRFIEGLELMVCSILQGLMMLQ